MLARIAMKVAKPDCAPGGIIMSSKSVEGQTCFWCVAVTTLEERIMGLKSLVGNTCAWCAAAAFAALFLLMAVWVVLLVNV